MRTLGTIPHPECLITLFFWNQKYIVKFEKDQCEQTFKVGQMDIASEQELREKLDDVFITNVLARFQNMSEDRQRLKT